jgi:hypothetical protein
MAHAEYILWLGTLPLEVFFVVIWLLLHATTLPAPDHIVWKFPDGVFTFGKPQASAEGLPRGGPGRAKRRKTASGNRISALRTERRERAKRASTKAQAGTTNDDKWQSGLSERAHSG